MTEGWEGRREVGGGQDGEGRRRCCVECNPQTPIARCAAADGAAPAERPSFLFAQRGRVVPSREAGTRLQSPWRGVVRVARRLLGRCGCCCWGRVGKGAEGGGGRGRGGGTQEGTGGVGEGLHGGHASTQDTAGRFTNTWKGGGTETAGHACAGGRGHQERERRGESTGVVRKRTGRATRDGGEGQGGRKHGGGHRVMRAGKGVGVGGG